MKILIVEDNNEKLREICKEIVKNEMLTEDQIVHANNVKEAKKNLAKTKFALMLLDINLPGSLTTEAEDFKGLEVLDFIKKNNRAIVPDHIVGITAYDDIWEKAQDKFSSLIWKVIKYDEKSIKWRNELVSTIDFLVENNKPPFKNDGFTHHVDIAVVCALEEELEALIETSEIAWEKLKINHDSNTYFRSKMLVEEKEIVLVAVSCPNMGMSTSAVMTHKLIVNFRPRLVCMLGICAGIKSKTAMGDILVADPSFEWGGGKIKTQGKNKEFFHPAAYQWRLDNNIRSIICDLAKDNTFLEQVHSEYEGKKPDTAPKLLVNAMASGSSVLESTEMVDKIKSQHKNLIGIEMETYAVFTACSIAEEPKPLFLSLKSVCDFGDEFKGDGFHHYASYTSAKAFIGFAHKFFGD